MPDRVWGRNDKSGREPRCSRKRGLFGTKSQKRDKVGLHVIVQMKDKNRVSAEG